MMNTQITDIASLSANTDKSIVELVPADHYIFTQNELTQIYSIAAKYHTNGMYQSFQQVVPIKLNNTSYYYQLIVGNLSNLFLEYAPNVLNIISNISELQGIFLDTTISKNLLANGWNISFPIHYKISWNSEFVSESRNDYSIGEITTSNVNSMYLDSENLQYNYTKYYYNHIQIALNATYKDAFVNDLQIYDWMKVNSISSKNLFIEISSNQIIRLLYFLYLFISFLSFISISVIMSNLIKDSVYDIKIFRMLGYTYRKVMMIFLGQAFLIGVIGFAVGMLFSYFTVYGMFASVAAIGWNIYLIPTLSLSVLGERFGESVTIAVLASLYPINKELRRLYFQ